MWGTSKVVGCWCLSSVPFFPGRTLERKRPHGPVSHLIAHVQSLPSSEDPGFFFLVEYAGLHLLDGGRWRCSLLLLLLLVLSSSSCSLSSVAAAPSEASRKMVDEIKFADARGLTCFFLRLYIVRYYFAIFVFPEAKAARA